MVYWLKKNYFLMDDLGGGGVYLGGSPGWPLGSSGATHGTLAGELKECGKPKKKPIPKPSRSSRIFRVPIPSEKSRI